LTLTLFGRSTLPLSTQAAAVQAEPGRDPKVEAWIRGYGVQYEYLPAVLVNEFDQVESLKNQARINEPVIEATVEEYAADMRNGDVFPPVVAYRKRGKLVVIDGNHRLVAASRAEKSLAVYVVRATVNTVLVIMTYEANVRQHGQRTTREDRLEHALWMVDNDVKAGEAARRLSLTESEVTRAVAARKAQDNAEDAGIAGTDVWKSIPKTQRLALGRINNNPALVAAARLVRDTRLDPDATAALVTAINKLRTPQLQEKFIRAKTDELAPLVQATGRGAIGSAGNRHSQSPASALRSILTRVRSHASVGATVAGLGPAERDAVAADCRDAAQWLLDVAESLES
jgi:hypothetical protein